MNRLNKELYNALSNNATLNGKYFPHVTIGKSKSMQKFQSMYNKTKNLLKNTFDAKVASVYSKIIIEDISGNTYLKNEIEYKLS